MYHIPDRVVPDVYMLGAIITHGIPQQSSPPLVVTENHSGIHHLSNSSLRSFCDQVASHEVILVAMYLVSAVLIATDFCFLLIQDIEAEPKENQHLEMLLQSSTLPA